MTPAERQRARDLIEGCIADLEAEIRASETVLATCHPNLRQTARETLNWEQADAAALRAVLTLLDAEEARKREPAGYLVFVGDEGDPFPGEPYDHVVHATPGEAVVDVMSLYPRLWVLPMYEGQPYEVDYTGAPITPSAEASDAE